ncbi:MAG: hypothetical protein ACLRR3_03880 [Eubacterium sp.]
MKQIKKLIQLKKKNQKLRKTTGTFTVEGKKMFVEIPGRGPCNADAYVSETFLKENGELVKRKKISDSKRPGYLRKYQSHTVTPQGNSCRFVKQKSYSIDYIIEKETKKSCIVV